MNQREAIVLDGKWLAQELQSDLAREISTLRVSRGRAPGLAVILVGDNPASKVYVGNKAKAAKKCGFETFDALPAADVSPAELHKQIENYNKNPAVDGILLQLPLPKHLSQNEFLDAIDPAKDADGLHPLNQGLLQRGQGVVRPCTPLGCMKLIDLAASKLAGQNLPPSQIAAASLAGKSAVVIGRSLLVGKPVATMLLERGATVTVAHSKTADLPSVCRRADILIAAVGRPEMVKSDWLAPGSIVIDVGINRLESGALVGDVEFEGAKMRCAAITPVPGGVGPLTITMLLRNTLESFKKNIGAA